MSTLRKRALAPFIGTAIGVTATLSVLSGGFNFIAHVDCRSAGDLATSAYQRLPATLVNSPYGGWAYGQGYGWGDTTSNGTPGAILMEYANLTLRENRNGSVVGPGPNSPCASQYSVVTTHQDFYGGGSLAIPAPSSLSDIGEAGSLSANNEVWNLSATIYFNNSFEVENAARVSTCGSGSRILQDGSALLNIRVPFNVSSHLVLAPYTMAFRENFSYEFPANFGTWAIDNLSLPGGPGGGWAFDFLGACPPPS